MKKKRKLFVLQPPNRALFNHVFSCFVEKSKSKVTHPIEMGFQAENEGAPKLWRHIPEEEEYKIFYSPVMCEEPDFSLDIQPIFENRRRCCYTAIILKSFGSYGSVFCLKSVYSVLIANDVYLVNRICRRWDVEPINIERRMHKWSCFR